MRPIPERIDRAVRGRIDAIDTKEQVATVQEAIQENRPLDAENERDRKIAYIARTVEVDPKTAALIADYQDPKKLNLSPTQESRAESLQGDTVDFVSVSFLDVGRAASRSVARVVYDDGSPDGTGFMISPQLFLTNQHVIETADDARSIKLEFNYEFDPDDNSTPVTRFALDPDRFFLSNPIDDLDFAVVAVGARLDGTKQLSDFGFLPLVDTTDKHIKGMFTNIIQHPEGRRKELVVRENRLNARTDNTLIYGADTLPGSSGSPVLNDAWEVIALHHWSAPSRSLRDLQDDGTQQNLEGNEGIRISSIVKQLKVDEANMPAEMAALLQEALNVDFRHPSLLMSGNQEGRDHSMSSFSSNGKVQEIATNMTEDGTATFVVPLVVSVRLGTQQPTTTKQQSSIAGQRNPVEMRTPPANTQPPDGSEAFKFVPDPNYANRKGYNRNFLGVPVDLPKLTTAQKNVAAKNQSAGPNDNPYELKYLHFSLVMHGGRRLPFFTAVNIDGASVVRVNRKTGQITSVESGNESVEGAEAYENWYNDPRLKATEQSDQSLYDNIKLKNFQRGHLVKRTDPSWGQATAAVSTQADTYHFTNCTPQHKFFNPNTSRWAGVENWITNGSDDDDLRVTVFSGPVLRDNDLKLSYIRVPKQFWKVVVRVDNGELLATAILADQSDLLAGEHESLGPEDLPQFPTKLPADYQITVRKIEQLTGLDFGTLRDHDTYSGPEGAEGAEGAASSQRPIHRFEDITIHHPGRKRSARTSNNRVR